MIASNLIIDLITKNFFSKTYQKQPLSILRSSILYSVFYCVK